MNSELSHLGGRKQTLRLGAVCLCALASFLVAFSLIANSPGAAAVVSHQPGVLPASSCPLHTAAEWQSFLDRASENEKWVETCEDSECDPEFYAFVAHEIQGVLKKCSAYIDNHPGIEACTHNLRRFTPAWMRQHDSTSYGFMIDNHEYFAGQDAADKPRGMMTPPASIVEALPDRDAVEAAARKSGLKYLTHDSALGGYRTFVLVSDPQDRFDQWMLLNLQKGQTSITNDTPMSVLTVQKKDAAGNPLPRVRLHFRDYFISHLPKGGYKIALHEHANGKCYSCHANGVRQLIARRTPILEAKPVAGDLDFDGRPRTDSPDFAYQRLMEFNKRLRSYGTPDWDGKVNPEDHGPALGAAQGCLDCHDGKSRGILTVSSSPAQLDQKMFKELTMPPDTEAPKLLERSEMKRPALSPREKQELENMFHAQGSLFDEFLDSRYPILRQWILQTPCS